MYIYDENSTSATKKDQRADQSLVSDTPLYPAHWAYTGDAATYATAGNFYTAFGDSADKSDMSTDGASLVPESGDKAAGSVEAAVAGQYAVKNTFKIGSKGANLENLIVKGASIKDDGSDNGQFDTALRVLVKCGANWVLCDKGGVKAASNTDNKLTDTVSSTSETTVDMYVFYDGDDSNVFTNNLENLTKASKRITVAFSATSTQTDKKAN